jgi:hypothetical protein
VGQRKHFAVFVQVIAYVSIISREIKVVFAVKLIVGSNAAFYVAVTRKAQEIVPIKMPETIGRIVTVGSVQS